jgi:hypothetical protein
MCSLFLRQWSLCILYSIITVKNIDDREHDSQLLVDMAGYTVYKYVMYHNIYNSNARQETIYFF